jgi:hypothetical protein
VKLILSHISYEESKNWSKYDMLFNSSRVA